MTTCLHSAGRRRHHSGFTLIELMIVLVIIGILANLAIPNYVRTKKNAEAAAIVADYHVVRMAAFDYYAKYGDFPRSFGGWRIPPTVQASLPEGFKMMRDDVFYYWLCLNLGNWGARRMGRNAFMGRYVYSTDRRLMQAVAGVFQGRTAFESSRGTLLLVE